ncbi:DEP domain-containing protein 7-like [Littorina saxatilis]|uniref:DEP domain-containing protein n=1 Tax=Littorina saxatilis TaxID=31220 RepID=A0AAN9BLJ6_9CAEN
MASSDSSASDPQSFHLETTMPLRESKANLGPFRATQIWNDMTSHMKSKVELKRRRCKMRYYDNCFTGTDAVDVVLHYLLSDKETFSTDLSREKAVKVCQLLMSKKVFEPASSRHHDSSKHSFEDSGGKLYCFPVDSSNVENEPPADDSDDDSLCDESDLPHCSNSKQCSFPLEGLSDVRLCDREADCGSVMSTSRTSFNCSLGSLRSLSGLDYSQQIANISKSVIEETWREVALAQLTTLIELTFLDGVLAPDKPNKRQQQHHNLIISNIVAKNWHLPITDSLMNLNEVGLEGMMEEEGVIQTAIACIECIPKGSSLLSEHEFHCGDSNAKRQAFEILRKHYSQLSDTILPGRFFDLHMAILNQILQHGDGHAVEALRLDMVLLPVAVKEELHRLLKFMTAVSLDNTLVLDPSDSNEVMVLRAFSDAVFRHKLLAPNLGSVLVQFMMQNMPEMFTIPRSLREKVSLKLYQIKTGQNVPDFDTAFCDRVSREEYNRQARDCTQEALIAMMNNVLDDTKVTLREKKNKLKQFQKCYPTLYEENFAGML